MIPKSLLNYRGSRVRAALIAASAVAVLAGCSTYDSVTQRVAQSITPYRITVVQGNFVSAEAAAKMQVGMSRAQVKAALGTPLLVDMFHTDRWDYLFYFKRGSTSIVQQRDFIVNFTNDRVASWSGGDDLPSELELLADIDGDKLGKKKAAAERATEKAADAARAASATVATAPAPQPAAANPVASPTDEAAAAARLPATNANAQAAQAANRATAQVATPSGGTPSVRAYTPSTGLVPPGTGRPSQPQLEFHRPPPPNVPDQSNPTGPAGSQSSTSGTQPAGAALQNQPLTATGQAASGTGG
jgi:outer membrane protein assembly factor BamE